MASIWCLNQHTSALSKVHAHDTLVSKLDQFALSVVQNRRHDLDEVRNQAHSPGPVQLVTWSYLVTDDADLIRVVFIDNAAFGLSAPLTVCGIAAYAIRVCWCHGYNQLFVFLCVFMQGSAECCLQFWQPRFRVCCGSDARHLTAEMQIRIWWRGLMFRAMNKIVPKSLSQTHCLHNVQKKNIL